MGACLISALRPTLPVCLTAAHKQAPKLRAVSRPEMPCLRDHGYFGLVTIGGNTMIDRTYESWTYVSEEILPWSPGDKQINPPLFCVNFLPAMGTDYKAKRLAKTRLHEGLTGVLPWLAVQRNHARGGYLVVVRCTFCSDKASLWKGLTWEGSRFYLVGSMLYFRQGRRSILVTCWRCRRCCLERRQVVIFYGELLQDGLC